MATKTIMRMVLKVIDGIAEIAIHRVVLGSDGGLCVSVHVDLPVWLGGLMTSELNVRDIYMKARAVVDIPEVTKKISRGC